MIFLKAMCVLLKQALVLSFFLHSYKVTGHGKGIYIFRARYCGKTFFSKILFFSWLYIFATMLVI